MALEPIIVGGLLSVAVCLLLFRRSGAWSGLRTFALLLALAAVAGLSWTARQQLAAAPEPIATDRPLEKQDDGYVTSDTCESCHPDEYASWHASYHRTMTQLVTPETVIPDWDGVALAYRGRTMRLERRGLEFWAEFDDPRWKPGADRPKRITAQVVLITGAHHEQDFWFVEGPGRQVLHLPWVYRVNERRWVPDEAVFLRPTGFLDDVVMAWNDNCIVCHSTHPRPRLGPDERIDTRVAEFGISCEACHGPAAQHVAANRNPQRRYRQHFSDERDETIVNPSGLSHRRSSEVCGQCHGISLPKEFDQGADAQHWREDGFRFRPGDNLHESRLFMARDVLESEKHPASLQLAERVLDKNPHFMLDRYWSDGMVRVSGREYNGLLETACFQKGEMSCLSCHELHPDQGDPRSLASWADDQLGPEMRGDEACLSCHSSYRETLQQHTRHEVTSTGSRCYNCHMPFTTYGLLKGIRSHTVSNPTARESFEIGRPNACNLCHLDQTLQWTADKLTEWYEQEPLALPSLGQEVALSALGLLRGDAGQRAILAWNLGWAPAQQISGTDWMGPYLSQLLSDPYDAVRFVAYRSLRTLPGYEDFEYDFVAPATDRQEAGRQAYRLWRGGEIDPDFASRVLLLRDGSLDRDKFSRLLDQRDDRHIYLNE